MSIARVPAEVLCGVCAFLDTLSHCRSAAVARAWRAIVRMPAASPQRITVPPTSSGSGKWTGGSIAHLRPQCLTVKRSASQADVAAIATVKSIRNLGLRIDDPAFTGDALAQLPLLAGLHLIITEACIGRLGWVARCAGIEVLSVTSETPKLSHHRSLHLAHVPTSVRTLRTNFNLCRHVPADDHKCVLVGSEARLGVGSDARFEGAWPPALTSLGVYWNYAGKLPATLESLRVRVPSRDAPMFRQVFSGLPLLRSLDLSDTTLALVDSVLKHLAGICRLQALRMRSCELHSDSLAAILRVLDTGALTALDVAFNRNVHAFPSLAAFTRLTSLALPALLGPSTLANATAGGALTSLSMGYMHYPPGFELSFPADGCRLLADVELPRIECAGNIPDDCLVPFVGPLSLLPALTSLDLSRIELGLCFPSDVPAAVRMQMGPRLAAMVRPDEMPFCADHFAKAARSDRTGSTRPDPSVSYEAHGSRRNDLEPHRDHRAPAMHHMSFAFPSSPSLLPSPTSSSFAPTSPSAPRHGPTLLARAPLASHSHGDDPHDTGFARHDGGGTHRSTRPSRSPGPQFASAPSAPSTYHASPYASLPVGAAIRPPGPRPSVGVSHWTYGGTLLENMARSTPKSSGSSPMQAASAASAHVPPSHPPGTPTTHTSSHLESDLGDLASSDSDSDAGNGGGERDFPTRVLFMSRREQKPQSPTLPRPGAAANSGSRKMPTDPLLRARQDGVRRALSPAVPSVHRGASGVEPSVVALRVRLSDASCARVVELLRFLVALLVCAWLVRGFRP